MSSTTLKKQVAEGAAWVLLEKLFTQAVGFVVGMILARLLTPDDYGTVALTTIFFAIANVLVDGGFGSALIQKKDSDDVDFNSVFYLNLSLSIVVYGALFFAAPLISSFYVAPELTAIIRVSAICVLFNAVNAIQNAELVKKMLFHLSFRISLITCITSAACGVTLAFLGYGVWALVLSSLIACFVGMIARWFIIAWRPRLVFNGSRLKPLFSYGWKMAISTLLDKVFANLNDLIIGKFYAKADVAFVNKGRSLPLLITGEIDATLGRVSFPALVLLQDDRVRLREAMRRMMRCSAFLVFPLMVGIAMCSQSLLRLLYGPQWLPAAPYMMLSCFSFALWPFHTINLKGIQALGRSDIFLVLEIVKKILALIVIVCASRLGVFKWMAISAFVLGPLSVVINAWPNKKLLDYTIFMQLYDVLPTALICGAESVAIVAGGYLLELLKSHWGIGEAGGVLMLFLLCKVLVQLVLAGIVFFALSYAFRLKPMVEYARVLALALNARSPRIASALEKWFVL